VDGGFTTWLSIVGDASGAENVPTTLTLHASKLEAGETAREHQFYIVANNLKKTIIARQLDEEEFSLEVSPWELTFYKTPQQSKTVALTAVPAVNGSTYTFGLDVKGNISWEGGIFPDISGNTLALKPGVNDGDATRGSTPVGSLTESTGSGDYTIQLDGSITERPITVTNFYKTTPALYTFTQLAMPGYIIMGPYVLNPGDPVPRCPLKYKPHLSGLGSEVSGIYRDGALFTGTLDYFNSMGSNVIYHIFGTQVTDGKVTKVGTVSPVYGSITLDILCIRE
jgi:hypothetical protein